MRSACGIEESAVRDLWWWKVPDLFSLSRSERMDKRWDSFRGVVVPEIDKR